MTKHDVFYQAMLARDYRFDGKFFVAVKTTGVYCRPICPARPKRENVEFFPSAVTAEKAGYRPCLRCRPESAPLSPAWVGTSAVVQRALKAIAVDGFFESDEDRFAEQFGVTARHLRRLFIGEIGLTPKQIAFNNRLNFARKLIVESHLPMTAVAMTAGFSSLRRFNDAFKKRFHRAPRDLRITQERSQENGVELSLAYRPPFDWNTLLAYFRSHRIIGVENISVVAYERVFRIGKSTGFLRVMNDDTRPQLKLYVSVDDPTILFSVSQRVRRMFDLDSDPLLVANSFQSHKFLNSLWKKYPGLRLARGWDPFETSVCTILGQLVSVGFARTLIGQLVERYGEPVAHPETQMSTYLFPRPEVLAGAAMAEVQTTRTRKAAIREFSRLVGTGEINLQIPREAEAGAISRISGLGPWSTECISLRALGDTDAFPKTDLVLKRAVEKHPDLDLEKIRPWRSYAAVYLWKHYAQELTRPKGKRK